MHPMPVRADFEGYVPAILTVAGAAGINGPSSPQPVIRNMFNILFHNDTFVAINKPSGIKVHRGDGDPRREDFVLQRLRDQIGRRL